jgi:Tat protein secretion system quality control protein TatD with DNase activity
LLTETDNPGGLKWLKDVVGMPKDVRNVVDMTARVRKTSPELLAQTIHTNFLRMIDTDPWLKDLRSVFSQSEG